MIIGKNSPNSPAQDESIQFLFRWRRILSHGQRHNLGRVSEHSLFKVHTTLPYIAVFNHMRLVVDLRSQSLALSHVSQKQLR